MLTLVASLVVAHVIVASAGAQTSTPTAANGATQNTAPDSIDPRAKALYDGAITAAKALKSIEAVVQTQFVGGYPPMLPPGLDAPVAITIEFGPDAAQPFKRVRLESYKDGKSATLFTFDGTQSLLIDNMQKSFASAGADPTQWYPILGPLAAGLSTWYAEQRMGGAGIPGANPHIVSITMVGETTVDATACDVIRVIRESDLSEMVDGGAAPEGQPATSHVFRMTSTIAIASSDSLPRSVTSAGNAIGGMDIVLAETTTLTAFKADGALEPTMFATNIPEGYAKAKAHQPGEPGVIERVPELKVSVGDKAPDFKLADLAGNEVTLASLSGKVVLLDFWATWCGPCKQAMPIMQKISDDYKDTGAVVLGVNMGERKEDAGRKYMESKKYTYGCLLAGDALAEAYGIRSIPTLVVIGKDGVITLTELGMSNSGEKSLRAAIDKALAK